MHPVRPLATTSVSFLVLGTLLAVLHPLADRLPPPYSVLDWGQAHAALLVAGFLLAGLFALHLTLVAQITGSPVRADQLPMLQGSVVAGALILGIGRLGIGAVVARPWFDSFASFVGGLVLVLASVLQLAAMRRILPRTSVVDVERDPLTKGDDASLAHVRMAHRVLPLGLLVLALGDLDAVGGVWQARLHVTGIHLSLILYGLLSLYGLGHLLVPRLSGVPAIAAGAIKGELHTTLLGITGMTVGFLMGHEAGVGRGLVVGLGPFVFLGMFTYMGVLGANIMKRKSRTHRVTPEFVYIPWTFAGVFWLISGVLMGILLNAAPDVLEPRMAGLGFLHVHATLFGGFGLLLLGWAHRILPAEVDRRPPPFSATRVPFLLLNLGLLGAVWASLYDRSDVMAAMAAALAASLVWVVAALRRHARPVTGEGAGA